MIYDTDGIKCRWHEYCKKLFEDDTADDEDGDHNWTMKDMELEPDVLVDEIRQSIHNGKNNKAMGLDNIPMEALKAGGDTVVMCLKQIIDEIWKISVWPKE